ncbi:MAG: hypothetical protein AVDCRST_MAG43-259 [uncultured Thermomicrobiales bacterium]|uniref:Uncharacterized protein n=1 Tax=uncultured Thermomicrobiales bacterium TaxID=1645740 RepID=A0A6J4U754_9BACT|nr:MAG: hypothetical protein AVDCRST_MAG43-259 [uncultured Thermomicrobiales bacterium]
MTDKSSVGGMIGASIVNQLWLNASMMALLDESGLPEDQMRALHQGLQSTAMKLVEALESSDPGARERIAAMVPELFRSNSDDNGLDA